MTKDGLLAVSELGELRLYDVEHFAQKGSRTFPVWIVGLQRADAHHLFVILQSRGIAVVDTRTMASRLVLSMQKPIWSLSVGPHGEIALALSHEVRVYSPMFGRLVRSLGTPTNFTTAAYDAGGALYALSGVPARLSIYLRNAALPIKTIDVTLHENATLSTDGRRLYIVDDYCGAADRRVLTIDPRAYAVKTLVRGLQEVRGMASSSDGTLYLSEKGCGEFNSSGVFIYSTRSKSSSSRLDDLPYGALYIKHLHV